MGTDAAAAANVGRDLEITSEQWLRYSCDPQQLHPALRLAWHPLWADHDTHQFVQQAIHTRAGAIRTALFSFGRRLLSDYDAYGLLGMYGMHLLSTRQARSLLSNLPSLTPESGTLLDVGAGDGAITQQLAPLFAGVVANETSMVLQRKLAERRFAVLTQDLSVTPLPGASYDVIACLNVLDRCARPRTLLTHLRSMLAPHGRLLLSVPLPCRPHVHVGSRTVDPEETLPVSDPKTNDSPWERGASLLYTDLLQPLGWIADRLSRVPYISQGDARHPLYTLDASVWVLRATPTR